MTDLANWGWKKEWIARKLVDELESMYRGFKVKRRDFW
jgi:hypothetical protein